MKQLTIILSILPFFVFGQKKGNNARLWAIDALFSPDTYAPPQVEADANFYQESAYHFGCNISQDFSDNRHWSVRSGLRYNVYRQRIESFYYEPIIAGFVTNKSYIKYAYLDIPLALRYTFGARKLRFYSEVIATINTRPYNTTDKFHITWGLSLGLNYQINPSFEVFTQPTFRKPIQHNNRYFFMLGIETGLKFRLPTTWAN